MSNWDLLNQDYTMITFLKAHTGFHTRHGSTAGSCEVEGFLFRCPCPAIILVSGLFSVIVLPGKTSKKKQRNPGSFHIFKVKIKQRDYFFVCSSCQCPHTLGKGKIN